MQGTSLEQDPYAARLRVRLLPGLSTISAQVQAVSLPTPQRRGSTRPRWAAGRQKRGRGWEGEEMPW